ncbi:MAG TPA: ATP-binding protein [Gemmatimonadota bacterium]
MSRRPLDRKWTIVLFRFLVAAAFAVFWLLPGRGGVVAGLALGGYLVSNLFLATRSEAFFGRPRLPYLLVVVDSLLLGSTIYLLEGRFTEFYYLYFLSIFLCALLRDVRSGVVSALLGYAVYLVLLQNEVGPGSLDLQEVLIRGSFLLSTVGLTTYLTQEVQRKERENLTLNSVVEISQRLASTLEPEAVFKLLLAKVSEIIPVQRLSLIRVEGDAPETGTVIATLENPRGRPFRVDLRKYPEILQAVRTRRPVVVANVETDPLMGMVKDALPADRPASILVLPIVQWDDVIGTLFLKTARPRTGFQDWELDFCQVVANAAGQAIFTAQAVQQEKLRTADLERVASLDAFLVGTLPMDELLNGAVDFFRRGFGFDVVAVALRGDAPNTYLPRARAADPELEGECAEALGGVLHLSDSLLGEGKPFAIRKAPGEEAGLLEELREEVFLPLVAGGQLRGCLILANREAAREDDRLLLLQVLANHVAQALDKALLHSRVEELNRQLAERVSEQDKYLASLVSLSADAIIGLDRQGRIESWNRGAQRIFGYAPDEILGASAARLFPDANGHSPDSLIRQAIEKHDVQNVEVVTTDAAGRERIVDLTLSAVETAWGDTKGISVIARDVTQRRRLEQRVAQAERMAAIGEVAASVAHEVRNPLFAISSIAQILGMECGANPELAELTRAMAAETRRLNRIVEDLLTFGRRRDLELRPVRPSAIVDELLALNAGLLAERGLVLARADAAPDRELRLDAEQVRQVFLNLLLNAVQASETGGAVRVETGVEQGPDAAWVLHVTNGGPGIPPEVRARVFELFFTTKEKGSGIGLAISRKIVEAHGGTLGFESEPGRTVFSVRLPLEAP